MLMGLWFFCALFHDDCPCRIKKMIFWGMHSISSLTASFVSFGARQQQQQHELNIPGLSTRGLGPMSAFDTEDWKPAAASG
jgi:hypothetical protein